MMPRPKLRFRPLTKKNWTDLEALFGARGACGGCWCMAWRRNRADFQKNKGAGNRRALRKLAQADAPCGVLAYAGRGPIGWCSVAPREQFSFLERSRVLKPVDEQPVWSVSCLFVAKAYRQQGVSAELLRAAVAYARQRGAKLVEGYPTATSSRLPDVFLWTGLPSAFHKAGFVEVARRSRTRPILRAAV
jgi:GNAT superfamily N-acetyltransferase